MKPLIGNFAEIAEWQSTHNALDWSYLNDRFRTPELWKSEVRRLVRNLLAFDPPWVPLDPKVEERWDDGDLLCERVSYRQPFGPRTEAFFLAPRSGVKLPAVVALHDHGGYKYFGKEKLVRRADEPESLRRFRSDSYDGSPWAMELARRGYAVLVPDVLGWGSRRLDPDSVPPEFTATLKRARPGSSEYIDAYNDFANGHETFIAKSFFVAGTTWPGVWSYEDRRALDYLQTRTEVDPMRIGCGGLSCGGLRTIFLAGLDERISCAVCVGFMSSTEVMVRENIRHHTWMYHLPYVHRHLDMPDIISMTLPNPLLIQYDRDDALWSMEGMEAADRRLTAIYEKADAGGRYLGRFYPGPHKFDSTMQQDAFDWFDNWLKAKP